MGYISCFNTCSHVISSLMHNLGGVKIVHERAFYTGTYLEGDSAYSLAWRGTWRAIHSIIACVHRGIAGQHHTLSFVGGAVSHSDIIVLKSRLASSAKRRYVFHCFFCYFFLLGSRQCAHLSSSFLLGTEIGRAHV